MAHIERTATAILATAIGAWSADPDSATLMRETRVVESRAQSSAPTRKVDTVTLGPLGRTPWQTTPFSIQTITEERLRNQQGSSLTDVLRAQPLVQSQTGGSRVTDYFTSRGFTSSVWTGNTSVEGLPSHNPVEPVEDKEGVEVMNGPNSFLYGITSPGGMVNSRLKRPLDTLLLRATAGSYGGGQAFVHVDAGGPVGPVGWRANLVHVSDGDAGVEFQSNRRSLASLAMDWRILPGLQWSLDASSFQREARHTQSIWMIGNASKAPAAPDASKNWGSPAGFADDEFQRAGTRLEWNPFPALSVRADLRAESFSREFALLRRNLAKGDTSYTLRVDYNGKNRNIDYQGDLLADWTLATGPVRQTFTLGYVGDYLLTKIPSSRFSKVWTSSAAFPNGSPYPSVPLFDTTVHGGAPYRDSVEFDSRSAIVLDRISVGDAVEVFAGINIASLESHAWGTTASTYDKSAATPSGGVVWTPIKTVSVYASYIQALQQGPTAPAGSKCLNAGEVLDPYRSHQVEVGAKASLAGLDLHLAAFRVDQANLYYDTARGTDTYRATLDGSEVHTGLELSAQGKVADGLSVSLGATLLDASIEKTSTPALQGKAPQGVAEAMGKIGAEWAVPFVPGLFLNGTVNYTGREWVNAANTISIPPVVTADAGLRWEHAFGHRILALRAAVTNLGGEDFWTTRSGILYLGDPRTVLASAEIAW